MTAPARTPPTPPKPAGGGRPRPLTAAALTRRNAKRDQPLGLRVEVGRVRIGADRAGLLGGLLSSSTSGAEAATIGRGPFRQTSPIPCAIPTTRPPTTGHNPIRTAIPNLPLSPAHTPAQPRPDEPRPTTRSSRPDTAAPPPRPQPTHPAHLQMTQPPGPPSHPGRPRSPRSPRSETTAAAAPDEKQHPSTSP